MKKLITYMADDGTIFNDYEECVKYEAWGLLTKRIEELEEESNLKYILKNLEVH